MIKAIFFDLDDTLLQQQQSDQQALEKVAGLVFERFRIGSLQFAEQVRQSMMSLWAQGPVFAYCARIDMSPFEGMWGPLEISTRGQFQQRQPHGNANFPDFQQIQQLQAWLPFYRQQVWQQALEVFGIDDKDFAQHLVETFSRERQQRIELFADAKACLARLQHFTLAMVTNGASFHQWFKVWRSGLEDFFDAIFISGDIGKGKPDSAIFLEALATFSLQPKEAIMVGNSLKNDIGGAHQSGMKAVWLNRNAEKSQFYDIKPDFEIERLSQLDEVLKIPSK